MSPLVNEDLTLGVIYGPREDNPFEKSGIALFFFFLILFCVRFYCLILSISLFLCLTGFSLSKWGSSFRIVPF